MTRQRLSFVALLLVTLVAGLAAQSQTPKRMMGGQLVLEDQGVAGFARSYAEGLDRLRGKLTVDA